jgi:ABC-type transport system involved in multi-copper enzyme maturation permease subunit
MLTRIAAVALNSYRESVRDRIFYAAALFGLILVGSSALLSPLTIGAQNKIVADVGLASLTLFGLVVVVFLGSGMVRKEMEKQTLATILAKPVHRREYLLGKYCGLALTLLLTLAVMAGIFLLVNLTATGSLPGRFFAAFYLAFLELLVINAGVLLFSTFVSPILSALLGMAFFAIGHLSQDILKFSDILGTDMQSRVFQVIYYVLPNLEVFNVRGAVVHGQSVAAAHLGWATLYALGYAALLIVVAGAVFTRKELR